jgi:hypothetical protein
LAEYNSGNRNYLTSRAVGKLAEKSKRPYASVGEAPAIREIAHITLARPVGCRNIFIRRAKFARIGQARQIFELVAIPRFMTGSRILRLLLRNNSNKIMERCAAYALSPWYIGTYDDCFLSDTNGTIEGSAL